MTAEAIAALLRKYRTIEHLRLERARTGRIAEAAVLRALAAE